MGANACNQRHQDKSNDWQLAWREKWFAGEHVVKEQRQRAQLMSQFIGGEIIDLQVLLKNINNQKNVFRRASFSTYLDRNLSEQNLSAQQVLNALNELYNDSSALVRERAAGIATSWNPDGASVQKLGAD